VTGLGELVAWSAGDDAHQPSFDGQAALAAQAAERASEVSVFEEGEAAWLYASGVPLRRIVAEYRPVYVFLTANGRTDDLQRQYRGGAARMDIRHFTAKQRQLRALVNTARHAPDRVYVSYSYDGEYGEDLSGQQGRDAA
jgi:hypothetical protein